MRRHNCNVWALCRSWLLCAGGSSLPCAGGSRQIRGWGNNRKLPWMHLNIAARKAFVNRHKVGANFLSLYYKIARCIQAEGPVSCLRPVVCSSPSVIASRTALRHCNFSEVRSFSTCMAETSSSSANWFSCVIVSAIPVPTLTTWKSNKTVFIEEVHNSCVVVFPSSR